MSLHADLLRQASALAAFEPKKHRQASLRRAVSAAYYAVFHLLVHDAARLLTTNKSLQRLLGRAFRHTDMYAVSRCFSGGTLPDQILSAAPPPPVPPSLRYVAGAFVNLQQARHEADYNLAKSFSRAEARSLIVQAELAFQNWKAIRTNGFAELYLFCLLLHDRWQR
jgi:uncharacterized protein (UPF0332 family)